MKLRAYLPGPPRFEISQPCFVSLLALPEENKLRVGSIHRSAGQNDVEPFLLHEAAAHADDCNVPALGKAERALQRGLAIRFVRCVLPREVRCDLRVGCGVPHFLIDPVGYSLKSIAHVSEHFMQAKSSRGCSELLRMTRAHGDSVVTEREAPLEKVDLTVPLEL